MKISTNKMSFIIMNIIVAGFFILFYWLVNLDNLKMITIIGILQYIYMISTWYLLTKNVMNVFLFFLILSFCFYMGQPVLFLLNIEITHVMTISTSPFTISQIGETLIFLLISMMLFYVGAGFAYEKLKSVAIKNINNKAIIFVGLFLFAISVVPQVSFAIDSLIITLTYGYSAIFESDFVEGSGLDGGLPRLLAGFFKPALLLLIIGYKNNKKLLNFWVWFSVIFTLILILSGQRGSNTLFIISIILLYNYLIKPFSKKQIAQFVLIAFIGIFLLDFISSVRNISIVNYNFKEILQYAFNDNFLFSLLGEMGFTLLACTTVMVNSPINVPFNNGETYLNSLYSLIPNLFWEVNPAALGGVDQVFNSYLMNNSGMGSSFIIEAYYNFGYYGFILMPIFGYLFAKLYFSMVKASISKNYVLLFLCTYMSVVILWFVRSETITFWRNFGYYTLFPISLIIIYSIYAKKTNRKSSNS